VHKSIKVLLWLYLALLLTEGALRKWLLPSLADPLLIVRDPVVLVIYALALAAGIFPTSRFLVVAAVLAVLSVAASLLGGHDHLLIIAYGLRINYLHLPLIWIMGAVLDRRDVERMGSFLLLMAVPMTAVMIAQFRSPMDALINRGVGGDGASQIFGADGRIRPPGLFAFITGPQLFYPLCAAFFFHQLGSARRLPWLVLTGCGLALAIALPVSISRTVMLATAVVTGAFLLSLPFSTIRLRHLLRPVLLLVVLGGVLSFLPIFKESRTVFMMRWDTAVEQTHGAAWGGVVDRTVNGFTNPYYYLRIAPFFGYGIGTGSNVGSRLASGQVGFALAEEEWGKVLLELGPVLGAFFIAFRISLTVWLGLQAWRALRGEKDNLPLLLFAATAVTVLQGQWAPPTVLGFAVVGSGLILAALKPAVAPDDTA